MHVHPNINALDGTGQLRSVAGALLMIALIVCVLSMIISAVVWAVATAGGNYQTAARGRTGVIVALVAAILAGSAVAWLKFLIDVGSTL